MYLVQDLIPNTHLTAWFELNNNNASAHQILYLDIPKHYVFNDRNKKWTVRWRGGDRIISRMYSVSPTDPEKFYTSSTCTRGNIL